MLPSSSLFWVMTTFSPSRRRRTFTILWPAGSASPTLQSFPNPSSTARGHFEILDDRKGHCRKESPDWEGEIKVIIFEVAHMYTTNIGDLNNTSKVSLTYYFEVNLSLWSQLCLTPTWALYLNMGEGAQIPECYLDDTPSILVGPVCTCCGRRRGEDRQKKWLFLATFCPFTRDITNLAPICGKSILLAGEWARANWAFVFVFFLWKGGGGEGFNQKGDRAEC